MEMSFGVDLNVIEDNQTINDYCSSHSDHKNHNNEKLFQIYESYLAKGDVSDTESEPEISFNEDLNDMFEIRLKTPMKSRLSGRLSCFADMECQKSVSRETTPNISRLSVDDMNDITIPWNLNEMNEKQIIDLINRLEDELSEKDSKYPQMAANNMKVKFDKQIQALNNASLERCDPINKNRDQILKTNTPYHQLLAKELHEIQSKSDQITKLIYELKLIRDLSNK